MKSIVFIDLDGTLWWNEVIPDSAIQAIEKAVQNGHLVFSNTGRTRFAAWPSLKGLPLNGQVYASGAEIWLNGTCIFYNPIPPEKTKRLIQKLSAFNIGIATEGVNRLHGNDRCRQRFDAGLNKQIQEEDQPEIFFEFLNMPDLSQMSEEDYQEVMKLSLVDVEMGSLDQILEEEDMIFTIFGIQDEDELMNGEITQKQFDKGRAFDTIRNILKQDFRTIALGDSANDISMFDAADLAIAMGNATEETKQHADYVTASVLDDGLYQAFEYAGLLEPDQE